MYTSIRSFAKINVTLRVTKLRDDGYHNICSLFRRFDAERLHVEAAQSDKVAAVGEVNIIGENIVSKALRHARNFGDVPFFDVGVHKIIPPGMGLGAGSGNAGAILDFIGAANIMNPNDIAKIGADVPFFTAGCESAIVSGIGNEVEPFSSVPILAAVVILNISSGTSGAYKALDEYWCCKYPLDEISARAEIRDINTKLLGGIRVGMLPNDFAPMLIEKHPEYNELFDAADEAGALAWGITGSGAAMFSLFQVNTPPHIVFSAMTQMKKYSGLVSMVLFSKLY